MCVFILAALYLPTGPARGQAQQPPPLKLTPRSVSRSHQFIIFGDEGPMRAMLSSAAEQIKEGLLHLLGIQADDWRVPIVIDLRHPLAGMPGALPPSRFTLGQTGEGLKIQIELLVGGESRDVRLRDELVRALLVEFAYRDLPDLQPGSAFHDAPAWLVQGCSACVESLDDNGAAAARFTDTLLHCGQALPIDQFLEKSPASMDATSQSVFRAYSYGLIRLLTQELPDGRAGLLSFINDLPAADGAGSFNSLRRHVPQLAGTDDLAKWWAIGLDRLGVAQQAVSILTAQETEDQLAALLTIHAPAAPARDTAQGNASIPGHKQRLQARLEPGKSAAPVNPAVARGEEAGGEPGTYGIEDFEKFIKPGKKHRAENARLLGAAHAGLLELESHAHPFYQPIVAAYEAVVARLARGDTHRAAERLKELQTVRAEVRTRQDAIADFLNWFEATQVGAQSGAFEQYLRSAEKGEAQPERREDAVSGYLDTVEAEVK